MNKVYRNYGFTLIELMIVIAIIGIISAIAMPSYIESLRKSRRVDAQETLMAAMQRMEVFYSKGATYTTSLADISVENISAEGHYTINIATATASCPVTTCYSIEASPVSSGVQKDDSIKGYRINSLGLQEMSYDGSSWVNGWK
jgi:type IV pilus assembly protein PilE